MANPDPITYLFTEKDITRFWSNIAIYWPRTCWLWQTCCKDNRYGRFKIKNQEFPAHRIAYFLSNNEDPGELLVCHKCDVKLCCNPLHLFLSTSHGNAADRDKKGRQAKGDSHGSRTKPERVPRGLKNGKYTKPEKTARGDKHWKKKLTSGQVIEIRNRRMADDFCKDLAIKYGVNKSCIQKISQGKTWKHLL